VCGTAWLFQTRMILGNCSCPCLDDLNLWFVLKLHRGAFRLGDGHLLHIVTLPLHLDRKLTAPYKEIDRSPLDSFMETPTQNLIHPTFRPMGGAFVRSVEPLQLWEIGRICHKKLCCRVKKLLGALGESVRPKPR
jgi:hypothetical protein